MTRARPRHRDTLNNTGAASDMGLSPEVLAARERAAASAKIAKAISAKKMRAANAQHSERLATTGAASDMGGTPRLKGRGVAAAPRLATRIVR